MFKCSAHPVRAGPASMAAKPGLEKTNSHTQTNSFPRYIIFADALQDRSPDVVRGSGDCFLVKSRCPHMGHPLVNWGLLRAPAGSLREDYFQKNLVIK